MKSVVVLILVKISFPAWIFLFHYLRRYDGVLLLNSIILSCSSKQITRPSRAHPLSVCKSLQRRAKSSNYSEAPTADCRFLINAGGGALLTEMKSPWLPRSDTQGRDNSGVSFSCHPSCDGLMKHWSLTAVMRRSLSVRVCVCFPRTFVVEDILSTPDRLKYDNPLKDVVFDYMLHLFCSCPPSSLSVWLY